MIPFLQPLHSLKPFEARVLSPRVYLSDIGEEGVCTVRYIFREKLLTFGHDSTIKNEKGQPVFDVDGKGDGKDEDLNGLITNLLVLIHLRKPVLVQRTYLQRPRLSTYTSLCAVIYLF